jgi:hypothetical protein
MWYDDMMSLGEFFISTKNKGKLMCNTRFPLLRFRSALHCGYSGITDIQDGLFFVLTRARTFKKARVWCAIANSKIFTKTFNIFIRGRYLYQ